MSANTNEMTGRLRASHTIVLLLPVAGMTTRPTAVSGGMRVAMAEGTTTLAEDPLGDCLGTAATVATVGRTGTVAGRSADMAVTTFHHAPILGQKEMAAMVEMAIGLAGMTTEATMDEMSHP